VNTIYHELLHLAQWNFTWPCTSTNNQQYPYQQCQTLASNIKPGLWVNASTQDVAVLTGATFQGKNMMRKPGIFLVNRRSPYQNLRRLSGLEHKILHDMLTLTDVKCNIWSNSSHKTIIAIYRKKKIFRSTTFRSSILFRLLFSLLIFYCKLFPFKNGGEITLVANVYILLDASLCLVGIVVEFDSCNIT